MSMSKIRKSSDSLDLSWVHQLDWLDRPPHRASKNYLSSTTGCHSSFHQLGAAAKRGSDSTLNSSIMFNSTCRGIMRMKDLHTISFAF